MRGPASFTSNDDAFGLLAEGFDAPARIAMSYNPPYYLALAEQAGYTKAKDLYAWYLSADIAVPERIVKVAERAMKQHRITLRPLNMQKLDKDAQLLKELYNTIWERNWGFVPLTDEEFKVIQTHPLVGAEIVAPLAGQAHLVAIVRNHHERYDGAGYPDGLAGKAIPLAGRLVAVCDAYDAMVNQRPYRAAMPHAAAIEVLVAGRDQQWDAELVDAFVAIQEQR